MFSGEGEVNDQALREKIVEMFNRGAAHLYLYSEYESLKMDVEFYVNSHLNTVIDSAIGKSDGKTNFEKHKDIHSRCVNLFRMIRDRKLTGYYFTPRTLIDKWDYTNFPESKTTWAEFMKLPWVDDCLLEFEAQRLHRFQEVVV